MGFTVRNISMRKCCEGEALHRIRINKVFNWRGADIWRIVGTFSKADFEEEKEEERSHHFHPHLTHQ